MNQLHLFRATTYCRVCDAGFLVDPDRAHGAYFCAACLATYQRYRRVFNRPLRPSELFEPTLHMPTKWGIHPDMLVRLYQYTKFVRVLVQHPEYRLYEWREQDAKLLGRIGSIDNVAEVTGWAKRWQVYDFAENYVIDYDAIRERMAEVREFWSK